ncbi:copper resistance protein B [Parerythrobacter aestuarii]|uniref:copper resistance protein B n=1 Tax=Parerythrobacter aestuarii TaxID=3020909 RepID=UPI0024DE7234|nr:copper resistance protein B [Parerythrobacter aestuarii]
MRLLLTLPLLALAAPLAAQDHDAHDPHKGHKMPAASAPAPVDDDPHKGHKMPTVEPQPEQPMDHGPDHGAMDHGTMDHGAMGHCAEPEADAPPPPRALEGPRHAADAIWGEQSMARSREQLARENGGMTTGTLMVERLEARIRNGEDAFLWDVQGWYGGDIDRVFVKSEGEGELGGSVEDAEVQLLYSRAIAPFFDLQTGARLDLEPETRSHLVLGVQGLAPYMFHVDGALFLSDRGDLTARLEGEYDQKITQRLILQPRVELEAAAQDIPEREIGAGFTKFETGLRLRYEIAREFAPYIGVGYEAKLGETAEIARSNGEDPDGFAVLLGIRAWF